MLVRQQQQHRRWMSSWWWWFLLEVSIIMELHIDNNNNNNNSNNISRLMLPLPVVVVGFVLSPPIQVFHSTLQQPNARTAHVPFSQLYSINPLMRSIIEQQQQQSNKQQQTILVGGKGGVGKTTTAAAIAMELLVVSKNQKNDDNGMTVLIVSTDPAHSLGDALDCSKELQLSNGQIISMDVTTTTTTTTGTDTVQLYAQEINANMALVEFQTTMNTVFNVQQLSKTYHVSPELLESFGINELQTMIQNPPPGLDELIALSNIFSSTTKSSSSSSTSSSSSAQKNNIPTFFDVVIVDTAPTGHTLRLLTLPQFLNGFIMKILKFQSQLSNIASTVRTLWNNPSKQQQSTSSDTTTITTNTQQQQQTPLLSMDQAMEQLQEFQYRIQQLQSVLQNRDCTKFVVVTIPTQLATMETKRLITELQQQQQQPSPTSQSDKNKNNKTNNSIQQSSPTIAVTDLIINQCIVMDSPDPSSSQQSLSSSSSSSSSLTVMNYYQRRVSGQQRWIQVLDDAIQKVSQSTEYQQNIGTNNNENNDDSTRYIPSAAATLESSISITKVPYFDVELIGIPALGYIGSQIYLNNPKFDHLLLNDENTRSIGSSDSDNNSSHRQPKFVICGGKGGVGKTTSSASLAVSMALYGGHKVALISTDPAHSLGDAVQMNLAGGQLQDCPLIGIPSSSMNGMNEVGSLSVLEIDPTATLNEFKNVVNQLMGNSNNLDASTNNGLRDTVKDLQDIFDTLPAGTDEVVALAKIVNLVKKGGFDRIVLDTAPTGHTLRMLSTPGFLADLIERLLRISDKINSNSMVQLMLLSSTTAQRREEIRNAVEIAKSTLLSFQFQMYDLEDIFANAQQTEFMIVTVPTELAVRESIRLLNDLTFESPDLPIKVRNIIVNQVLNEDSDADAAQAFLSHIAASQANAIAELRQFIGTVSTDTAEIVITQIPYLDTEPRGIYGLKALASELTRETTKEVIVDVN